MPNSRNVIRRQGEYWTVVFDRRICRMRHSVGLTHLAYLLAHPHEDILALHLCELAHATPPEAPWLRRASGDAGPIIDATAVTSYAQRLRDLRAALAEAEAHNDIGRAETIRAEIDAIQAELAGAIGLGGCRRVGAPLEQARVRVTKSIRLTMRRIGRCNPALDAHLTATIRTGTSCTYLPDPRVPIRWTV
jgi:hypothetical protein